MTNLARRPFLLLFILIASAAFTQNPEKRLLTLDDLASIRDVEDPQLSPDGDWVAYIVRTDDLVQDKRVSHLWMTSWDGTRTVQLTFGKDSEAQPRWSPDGKYLAFLSSRGVEDEITQVWLLNRAGGEAERVTDFKGGVSDVVWSPDSKRLALIVSDPDPDKPAKDEKGKPKTPKPITIDRFQFKEDRVGYLGKLREHLYVFDLATRKADVLTPGNYNDGQPAWSPDGSSLVFVSRRGADFDRTENYDLYVIEAKVGAQPRQLTTFDGPDSAPGWDSVPAWSPDGKQIAYVQGGPEKLIEYAVRHLAVIPAAGGKPNVLTASLDRNVSRPRWSADGNYLYFTVEDDRTDRLARVSAKGGRSEDVLGGRRELSTYDMNAKGRVVALISTPQLPPEVFAAENGTARQLSHQNDELLSKLKLATTEEVTFRSKDGTSVNGYVVKPPDFKAGVKYPTILRIHGGPVSQFNDEFTSDWQLLAAHGYVVVAANPRGSSGRGEEYAKGIYADWGNRDSEDVLAVVDYAVSQGIADPARLGVGGWSYGGMLTDEVIARDQRFKVATSGASIADIFAGYGTDQYVRDYEQELGRPWEHPEVWTRVSYPFFHADKIVTPTLFLCGDKDFNVPLLNSEQMYQALRSLGVETQLIIYPGQYHGLTKPSYLRDRLERYLAWYDKHLMTQRAANP
jgi:dipeptidyl aminopeptidase/acylaminoacyl peptidase